MVGYRAMHYRVVKALGPATERDCAIAGCVRGATEWAWTHEGPSDTSAEGYRFGTEVENYIPICHTHHIMIDRGGTLTHCPNGHDRAEAGVHMGGGCRLCHNEASHRSRRTA